MLVCLSSSNLYLQSKYFVAVGTFLNVKLCHCFRIDNGVQDLWNSNIFLEIQVYLSDLF
jgi:hypothetical protein